MKFGKLLVLGATGQTGKIIVEQALRQGHEVRTLVRDRSRLDASNNALDVVEGDVTDATDLRGALDGCDAVIMALGHPQKWNSLIVGVRKHRHLLRDVAVNLVNSMPSAGCKRLVAISASGAGDSFNQVPRWFQLMIRYTGIRQPYRDHGNQEQAIKASSLDWTIARPVRLIDTDQPGKLQVFINRRSRAGYEVSRTNVAMFCVDTLQNDRSIGQCATLAEREADK